MWYSREDLSGAGTDLDIFVSRSQDNGVTWTAPSLLSTSAFLNLWAPQVTTDGGGNWIAVWHSGENLYDTGTDDDIFISHSTDNGASWGDTGTLNSNATVDSRDDLAPKMTTDGAGNWVAVWESPEDNFPYLRDIFVSTFMLDIIKPPANVLTPTITPATTGPTNASSIDFAVTFNEDVEKFDSADDVVVAHCGTSHTDISITGGPQAYSVTGISAMEASH